MEKILVIEDDKEYQANIKILLEEESFNVFAADNGFDGLENAKNMLPDLIICDIMLPDIDGYMLLKELRKREKTKVIPFIFLTAKSTMSDLRKGMNLGADDYITKPFLADDLLTAVKTRLEKVKVLSAGAAGLPESSLSADAYIFLPNKDTFDSVHVSDIVIISSEGVYSWVHTSGTRKYMVRKLLKEWEKILPQASFIRIHKCTIINKKYIKKIEKWFNGALRISLDDYGEQLIVSRRFASGIKKSM